MPNRVFKPETFFVSWQDPSRNLWYPVARFRKLVGEYEFCYTVGAKQANADADFFPFLAFPEIDEIYYSDSLFPFFKNRIMNPSRPDYGTFLDWLGLDPNEQDPLVLLAATPAREEMDYVEVFPEPAPTPDRKLGFRFFTRGLRHFDSSIQKRVLDLNPGEELSLMRDLMNPVDPDAFMVRTKESYISVGYLPRHLRDLTNRLVSDPSGGLRLWIEKVNDETAPIQFRIQCRIESPWPEEGVFVGEAYDPIRMADVPSLVAS
ncbi:MAG: HIRAN domain-containing protein [Candidatus Omnitrophica bacterium]|nr:HIRAN domain-containing protein [Candidatus Omnitrophota bacterium]